MNKDLSFWKTNTNIEIDNNAVYIALSDKKYLDYIDEIPMYEIQEDFNQIFKDWKNDNDTYYEKDKEAFQLMITKQFVRADCYGMTETSMNNIIDILFKYNCPLYDSSIDVRFDDDNF